MTSEKKEIIYWNFFNLIIKFTGFCFIIISALFLVSTIVMTIEPSGELDITLMIIKIILSIILIVTGFLIIKAKKYYPKHIKEYINKA